MALVRRPAEDEAIRDLRRALHSHGCLPSILRRCATPDELRDGWELLEPDAGRVRDVAQPGGFRRHHVRKASPFNCYAHYQLPQLLRPSLQSKMFDSYWSVMDGLFIGDRDAAEDPKFFMENKVTRVVNCSASAIENHYEMMGISYLNFSWRDVDTQMILDRDDDVVTEVFNFMEEAFRRGEGVLIQSFYGRSRSCCILTAYLMKKYKWSMQTALEYLSFRCPIIGPNDGFLTQLEDFEQRLAEEDEPTNQDCNTQDDADPGVSAWDEKMLLNTYANCQRSPLSDMQISSPRSPLSNMQVSKNAPKIQFSDHIADVKPYDVGSMLEDSAPVDPCDRENRKPAAAASQTALKSALKSTRSHTVNEDNGVAKDCDTGDGKIVIQRRTGLVTCEPDDIIPKKLGIQIHSKTIILEYVVPRYGLRAHHSMQVELDGPKLPETSKTVSKDFFCDAALANRLLQQHEPWLAGVSSDQLAKLVGRLRCPGTPPKRCKQHRTDRAPGRSPR